MNPLYIFKPTAKSTQIGVEEEEDGEGLDVQFHTAIMSSDITVYMSVYPSLPKEERAITVVFIENKFTGFEGTIKQALTYIKNKLYGKNEEIINGTI